MIQLMLMPWILKLCHAEPEMDARWGTPGESVLQDHESSYSSMGHFELAARAQPQRRRI